MILVRVLAVEGLLAELQAAAVRDCVPVERGGRGRRERGGQGEEELHFLFLLSVCV